MFNVKNLYCCMCKCREILKSLSVTKKVFFFSRNLTQKEEYYYLESYISSVSGINDSGWGYKMSVPWLRIYPFNNWVSLSRFVTVSVPCLDSENWNSRIVCSSPSISFIYYKWSHSVIPYQTWPHLTFIVPDGDKTFCLYVEVWPKPGIERHTYGMM